MPDQIRRIRGIIEEHRAIEEQLRQALVDMEDWQITLETTVASGEAAQVESLSAKQWGLVQAISALDNALIEHYQRVETELVEFTGPVISEALRLQHREILDRMRSVRRLLTDTDLKSLSLMDLAEKYPDVGRELENTYRVIGELAVADNITLRLVLRGLLSQVAKKK